MHAQPIADLFGSLPQRIKENLLAGATHPGHLLRLAQLVLDEAGAGGSVARSVNPLVLTLTAWSENPLSGILAANQLNLAQAIPGMTQGAVALLRNVVQYWRQPEAFPPQAPDPNAPLPEQLAWHQDMARAEPTVLYWKERAVSLARQMGRADAILEDVAGWSWPEELGPVRDLTLAEALLADGQADRAIGLYERHRKLFPHVLDSRLAESCLRAGQVERACALWLGVLLAQPWNIHPLLLLHDVAGNVRQDRCALEGRVVILLYSFNNADEMDTTLASLAASELGGARIIGLDNGSSDGTGRVMLAWQERLGADRMDVVELPVNIGAPAARNWLMHLKEVGESDWAVYLDDDVELPSDWLMALGAAARRYPEAGVWGCKVVDHMLPLHIQSAETALLPPADANAPLSMWALHDGSMDTGRFDHLRPAASVTGCCHLFRTANLRDVGPFDIRFSPTQFDDLDRDLRMLSRGGYAVYSGHALVRHKRLSGGMTARSAMELGNVNGNMHKLNSKYDAATIETMRSGVAREQERDLMRKAVWLERYFKNT